MSRLAQLAALITLASPFSARAIQQPRFDRVTATIDSVTYDHIATSVFTSGQLSGVGSTVIMPDGSRRRGIVLHGAATSVAFVRSAGGSRGGSVTLALASERRGGLDDLSRPARAASIAFDTITLRTEPGGEGVEWRRLWRVSEAGVEAPRATLVVGEPHPAFIALLGVQDSLPMNNLSRLRMQRGSYDPSRLFADVVGVTLALSERDIALFHRALEATGAVIEGEGLWVVIRLDGFTLRLVPAYERPGLRRLDVALTRQLPGNPMYRFGPRSKLRFGPGPAATWEF